MYGKDWRSTYRPSLKQYDAPFICCEDWGVVGRIESAVHFWSMRLPRA
jgi:hypothetical protein